MDMKNDEDQEEDVNICMVSLKKKENGNEDISESNLDREVEGIDDLDVNYTSPSSVSVSNSSENLSSFISISTKFSESILSVCSNSPISPKQDLDPACFESSSESSIPTFPSNIYSISSNSLLKTNEEKQKELIGNCLSIGTSQKSLEELLSKNLVNSRIIIKDLNDLVSNYSGNMLSELFKLDLKSIVENFFGIYSRDYYERYLPLICSFLSVLFELSFKENKLNELNSQLWSFFEYIMQCIIKIFDIKEIYELPIIPVVYWMIESWNNYDMFLKFKNQVNEEIEIKNKLNRILFSLHIRKDLEIPNKIFEYYFKLLLEYRPNDEFQGCILYVIISTKFLVNYLLLNDLTNYIQVNYNGIIEIFNNFDQNRRQIFSKALDILILNSKLNLFENSTENCEQNQSFEKIIPIYFFSAFFIVNYSEKKTIQKILLDIINSICDNFSLKFEHKKHSILHIINLLLFTCKNTSSRGSFDTYIMELLLEISNLEIWRYFDRVKTFEVLILVDEIIRSLTNRVNLCESSKNELELISGLYKLQSVLLVVSSNSLKGRDQKKDEEVYDKNLVELGEDSWRVSLINTYLSINEKDKGIQNIGNTCYLNSAIQCLVLSYYFLEWLYEYMRNNFSKPNKLIKYLYVSINFLLKPIKNDRKYDILTNIYKSNDSKSIDLRFIREISSKFTLGKQHDTCEFLRYLLTNIDNNCLPFTMISEDFTECLSCGLTRSKQYSSLSIIDLYALYNSPFNSEYGENLNLFNHHTVTLESLIESYFSAENISNSLECDNCQQKSVSKRWTSIINPPKYVILAIHNYFWDRKLNKAMKQTKLKIKFNEFFVLNHHKYIIYALIFHKGKSTSSGHYFAIGRKHFYDNSKQKNPNWFEYNDNIISKIESFKQIEKYNENPFLIFALLADD